MKTYDHYYDTDQLYRLIYSSSMKAGTTKEAYIDILSKARKNNKRDNISGILAFGDGSFLQILEGNRRTIWNTFSRIMQDPRHREVQLIDFAATSQRMFGTWSMQGVTVRQETLKLLDFEDYFLPRHWSAETCLLFAVRYCLYNKLTTLSELGQPAQTAPPAASAWNPSGVDLDKVYAAVL